MPTPPSGKTPTQRGKRSRASPSPNVTGSKKNKLDWADEEDSDDDDRLECEGTNEQNGSIASDVVASDGSDSIANGYVPFKVLVREIEDVVNECLNSDRILSDSFGARLQESARVIKEQYIEILEENRDLRIKLDKAHSANVSKFEPRRTYRDVLGTVQTTEIFPKNVLTPSRTKDVKTVVIKLKTPVQDVAQREQKLSDLKNCVGGKLDKYKVDRVLQRSENIIVKAPWNDSDTESAIEKLRSIDGAEIRLQSRLDPEIIIFKEDFVGDKEELKAQSKFFQDNLNVEDWIFTRTTQKTFVIRVPAKDRSCLVQNGLYVRNMKLKVKDYIDLKVCYDCGQCHSKNKPCVARNNVELASCCLCGGQHQMGKCPKRGTRIDLSASTCSLCKSRGHNALFGELCDVKLKHLRAKLAMTDYGDSQVPYRGSIFDQLCY